MGVCWVNRLPLERPDGVRQSFTTPTDYLKGSLRLLLNGAKVYNCHSEDGTRRFDLGFVPDDYDVITVEYLEVR